jgi:hypothetical protein
MRNLCILVIYLGVLVTGCIPIVTGQADRPVVPDLAFKQLSADQRSVVGQARRRVFSIPEGLFDVRRVSPDPIVATTGQSGWFFYATSVATNSVTQQPGQFISGYAIQRGTRRIIYWSVW